MAPAPADTLQALATGTVRTTQSRVTLEYHGSSSLMVWPVENTRWDEANRAIHFRNESGQTVTIIDGDRVQVGGGGALGNMTVTEWLSSVHWVAPPGANCPLEFPRWINEVTPL